MVDTMFCLQTFHILFSSTDGIANFCRRNDGGFGVDQPLAWSNVCDLISDYYHGEVIPRFPSLPARIPRGMHP
jgi:hypothetical protein